MATWSISPNGASITADGKATFPKNSGTTPNVYTITYTSGVCTASTTYTIPTGCSCSEFTEWNTSNLDVQSGGGDVNISHIGGWVAPVIKWHENPNTPSSATTPDWISVFKNTSGLTIFTVSENSGTNGRYAYPSFNINESECRRYSIYQAGHTPTPTPTINKEITLTVSTGGENIFISSLAGTFTLEIDGEPYKLADIPPIDSPCNIDCSRNEWIQSSSTTITLKSDGFYGDINRDHSGTVVCNLFKWTIKKKGINNCCAGNTSTPSTDSYMAGIGSGLAHPSALGKFEAVITSTNDINNVSIVLKP